MLTLSITIRKCQDELWPQFWPEVDEIWQEGRPWVPPPTFQTAYRYDPWGPHRNFWQFFQIFGGWCPTPQDFFIYARILILIADNDRAWMWLKSYGEKNGGPGQASGSKGPSKKPKNRILTIFPKRQKFVTGSSNKNRSAGAWDNECRVPGGPKGHQAPRGTAPSKKFFSK